MAGSGLAVLLMIATLIVLVWPVVRILHKAGRSGWWVLLLAVPVVNFIMIWVFAYTEWPNVRDETLADASRSS